MCRSIFGICGKRFSCVASCKERGTRRLHSLRTFVRLPVLYVQVGIRVIDRRITTQHSLQHERNATSTYTVIYMIYGITDFSMQIVVTHSN